MKRFQNMVFKAALISVSMFILVPSVALARDLEYDNEEVSIYVTPGEPTQVRFPENIAGGFKKRSSALNLERRDQDLIVFATEGITELGEAIIVRLGDGRSYSVRIRRSTPENGRDDTIRVLDARRSAILSDSSEDPSYRAPQDFKQAPPNSVSGFMRELVLVSEFGKSKIPGFRESDRYTGETVIQDGTIEAKIDKIFIGGGLWGYVLDVTNLLDTTQQINPATFRIDGTRAVSAQWWELAPQPINVEQQAAGKHTAKLYIVTKARN